MVGKLLCCSFLIGIDISLFAVNSVLSLYFFGGKKPPEKIRISQGKL